MNEPEDFYLWFYNSDAYHQDLRGKAGKICRIIYDIFRKEVKDIYLLMENELYSLTKFSPSSFLTFLFSSKSSLFPIKNIFISGLV